MKWLSITEQEGKFSQVERCSKDIKGVFCWTYMLCFSGRKFTEIGITSCVTYSEHLEPSAALYIIITKLNLTILCIHKPGSPFFGKVTTCIHKL